MDGLIIFIKNMVLGAAKTRIAKTTGDEKALKIYKSLLEITRNTAKEVDAERFLFYNDEIIKNDDWNNNLFHKRLQSGSDLGKKMVNAFRETLEETKKVVIIGSDCPYIDKEIIKEAFESLEKNDLVIGPAKDGGYYLLGIKKSQDSLFENMTWSTETVFSETMKRAKLLHLKTHVLKELSDVDFESDWSDYLAFKNNNELFLMNFRSKTPK